MTNTIKYSRRGKVGWLLLNHPERHNSLGEAELTAIQAALRDVAGDDSVRALVVTGAGGRTFCAGASLQELNSGQISGELFQETTDQLAALAVPTVCAISGNVFGGGVELALSCDFRIGVEGSRMRVPAAAIGLCYPVSGIQRFVQRLGVPIAKRLLLAAEEMSSAQMMEIGFVDQLVPAEQLEGAAMARAEDIAQLAPLALRAMKQVIHGAAAGELDRAEADRLVTTCLHSEDLQEGFAAQKERRPPNFRGR